MSTLVIPPTINQWLTDLITLEFEKTKEQIKSGERLRSAVEKQGESVATSIN